MDKTVTTKYGDVKVWVGIPTMGKTPLSHPEAHLRGNVTLNEVKIFAASGFGDSEEEAEKNLVTALETAAESGTNTRFNAGFAITSYA